RSWPPRATGKAGRRIFDRSTQLTPSTAFVAGGLMALIERSRDTTLASALAGRATSDPESVYIRFGDQALTVGRLESDAESLAAALAGLGVGAGDRVALVLPPCPEFVVSMFAASKLGAVVVPLSPRATTVDLQYMLRHSEASCAV